MIRNLLLLLEPTRSGLVAKDLACHVARQCHASITGLAVEEVNSPASAGEMLRREVARHHARVNGTNGNGAGHVSMAETVSEISEGLSNVSVPYREKVVSGAKYALLSQEAEGHDLIVLGREGNLTETDPYSAKEVINLLLEYRPRPVIVAPPRPAEGQDILLAYDGSANSSRAIHTFVLMGLMVDQRVHILTVNRKKRAAEATVQLAESYLGNHRIQTTRHVVDSTSDCKDVIMEKLEETGASMVVAGAYGNANWERHMFGSTSDYLIQRCPVPLFTCH